MQDSLQQLAPMSESDRNAAIDRVITLLKKKEKEERNQQAEENAQRQLAKNGGMGYTSATTVRHKHHRLQHRRPTVPGISTTP